MNQYIKVRRWEEQEPNMDMKYQEVGTTRWGVTQESIETLYKEIVIFTGETSVQYLFNERIHGVSKNNKHFFKFQTVRKIIYTIKPNAYGEMVGKFYLKEGRTFRNVTQGLYYALNNMTGRYSRSHIGSDVFAAQVRKVAQKHAINVDDTMSIFDPAFTYPALRHMEPGYENGYPTAITRYAATNDLGVFVRRAFGKTRYRKDLVKSVANLTSINVFMIGWSFRGLVPIDWIISFYQKFAKKNPRVFSDEKFLSDLRKHLYRLPKKQLHKIFRLLTEDTNNATSLMVRDLFISLESLGTNDLYEGVEDLKFTSLKDAHDKFSTFVRVAETRKRNAHYLEPLEMTNLAKQINSIEYPSNADIRLKPASCAMDLVEWGAMMGHCIGSYTSDAIRGYGTFGAILQHGKVVGNFHYDERSSRMMQMFGKHNGHLDNDVLVAVFKTLIENTKVTFNGLQHTAGTRRVLSDPRILELKKQAEHEEHYKKTPQFIVDNPEGALVNPDWVQAGYLADHVVVHNWDGGVRNVWAAQPDNIVVRRQVDAREMREYERFVAQQNAYAQRPRMNGQWGI